MNADVTWPFNLDRRWIRWLGLAWLLLLPSGAPGRAQEATQARDLATKAAMIYNFGRFATWPDTRFDGPQAPVVVCIDPSDPLALVLSEIDGKPLGGRNLMVRRTTRVDRGCNMAYISPDSVNEGYLASLRDRGVLTIGETPNFSRNGAIQLVTIGRQIRFQVNQSVALAVGVRLSSNLMRLAVSVR